MRMVDIIEKKRDGLTLSAEEIEFVIHGYVKGTIPDYQISAWLMAIYFVGMTDEESAALTKSMLYSGDVIDLSPIKGLKVDKHSTGGVGDKTTLILGPLVASAGAKLAKLSGRGLGHTGGTLDKLESIDGCHINLSEQAFIDQVNKINIAVAGQTAELVPADKLLYALRDVTGSVPSIPLIASSIMSKKLAAGADVICLDVKIGDGAFMKTIDDARILSRLMVNIGKSFGKIVIAFVTDMNQPLGLAVGNRLEVKEAIDTLSGHGPHDLETLCVEIGSHMIYNAKQAKTLEEAKTIAYDNLHNGKALAKFYEFITAQGGHIDDLEHFIKAKEIVEFKSKKTGYIKVIKALNIGLASMKLGGGRETKDDIIDPMVGIVLAKKIGNHVNSGETLARIYADKPISADIFDSLTEAFDIVDYPITTPPIILEIIR
ncbi:MAG: pyrimidine-nucleoside phosphorylase [Candidatus Izemoplasmatales bacterium]|nr:pyrimidine-nucleoside phosphorylase [Candidatus Izemoplasmatales bacterium]MDD3864839.1 pyrimidine-nucleoside phosphorylase [Candidatus Izemoplasmatales bacterium]